MEPGISCRAYSDKRYDYYRLTQDLGGAVPAGAIFVHDTDDHISGSPACGCLKLCWTKDGNCFKGKNHTIGGGTVVFHASFINSDMFEIVSSSKNNELQNLISKLEVQLSSAKEELAKLSS